MELRVIDSTEGLRAEEAAWDRLWERSGLTIPSARARLVALWADSFAPTAAFRALVVKEGQEMLAAIPLVGGRFLRLLGAGRLPCNHWAASGDLLLDPASPVREVIDCLVTGLSRLPWSTFVFEQIPFEELRWCLFRDSLVRHGYRADVLEQHRVGFVEIDGDWAAYEATRKSRHRQRRRRNARMLEKAGATELAVYSEPNVDDVDVLMRRGFEVEHRSWKGRDGTSVLENPQIREYYLAEARELALAGELELAFLEHDGQPIAFCYGWNTKGVRCCVKIGFDESFSRFGPGQQLMMRLLESAHADRDSRLYDFRGRLVPWTESWITGNYPVGRLVVAPRRTASGLACGSYVRLHPRLKRARQRLRSIARSGAGDPA